MSEKTQLERIQMTEVELLRAFVDYCERHHLRYYLSDGTLLGAVRHGTIIPWDDDMDVQMPRPDYEKFIAAAQAELPAHVFLQNYKTDPEFPFPITKLRNSNTTFVETGLAHLHMNHGIYLDIFPLDGVPSRDEHFRRRKKLLWYAYAVSACNGASTKDCNLRGKISMAGLRLLTAFTTSQKILEKEEIFRRKYAFDESEFVDSSYNCACDARAWLGEGKLVSFYDFQCRIPENADACLREQYGDYWQLPPVEERCPPHHVVVCDLDKPYTEYVK